MDKRSKKVIFTVHCLLNQNARAETVAKCPGAVPEFLEYCIDHDFGIVPIECPQLMFEPIERSPETKEHYLSKISIETNKKVAQTTVATIKKYLNSGYEVCGVFGVSGSPTCGAVVTHRRDNEGKSTRVRESGVFFDQLKVLLDAERLPIPCIDWDIRKKGLCTQ